MATCPKHGCVLTETITDDVFCGVCRDSEKTQRIKELEADLKSYEHYVGGQMLMSDFRTAEEMREALTAERFLSATLRASVIQMLTNQRWTLDEATEYVNTEFSSERAMKVLKLNENKADNIPV